MIEPAFKQQYQTAAPMLEAQTDSVAQTFEQRLDQVSGLDDFVALMQAAGRNPAFFPYLYGTTPRTFEKVAERLRTAALPRVKNADDFAALMGSLPVFLVVDPATQAPVAIEVFDAVTIETVDASFEALFAKWLEVWPVKFAGLPKKFSRWLSGGIPASNTSSETLQQYRRQALECIYDRWLGAEDASAPRDRRRRKRKPAAQNLFAVNSYGDFAVLTQLVPAEFWYWHDSLELSPREAAEYINKREEVWIRVREAWGRVRAHNTGLVDLPFLQAWTLANAQPWPGFAPPEPGHDQQQASSANVEAAAAMERARPLSPMERFLRSRRGRIWA